MSSEYRVEELVPHSGKMSLLDSIVVHGDDWLHAEVKISKDSMFVEERGVPAWIGMEYMAQAIGAFAGLQERLGGGAPKLGFLLGTRKYICTTDFFPVGNTLSLKVTRELQGDNGLSVFQCMLQSDGIEATASLNVFQPEDADKFLQEAIS